MPNTNRIGKPASDDRIPCSRTASISDTDFTGETLSCVDIQTNPRFSSAPEKWTGAMVFLKR